MTLHDYMLSLRKSWLVIVLLTVLGAAAGYGYAQLQPESFRSQASVMVIPTRGDSTSELVQGSNYVQSLVQTYAVLATSPTVLNPVIEELELNTSASALAATLTVEAPLNTVVLEISAQSRDPEVAQQIANAVAAELAVAVRDLSPTDANDQSAVRIATIAPAKLPQFPVSPNSRMLLVLGTIGGLAIGVVFALGRRLFATRLTSLADIAAVTDAPVLGEVYDTNGTKSLPAVVRTEPTGAVAESMRNLVAGLRFADVDGKTKVILVTSANSGDGKSSVTVATALILAEQARSVLLIDADLRRASVAKLTQLEGAVGLTTVLLGDIDLAQAIQPWGNERISVLASGVLPPNPGQILASGQLRRLVESAREQYDYVLIDSPPVLAVSDPRWLAPLVDGVMVVVRQRSTRRDALARTLMALEATRTTVLGIVVNGAKRSQRSPYYEEDARGRDRRRLRSARG